MRKLSFISCLFLLLSGIAYSQTLGEVAKKEKERRKKNEKSEKVKVITEKELSEAEGEVNLIEDLEQTSEKENQILNPTSPDAVSQKDLQWEEIRKQYNDVYQKQKKHLEFLRGHQKYCEDGTPPPGFANLTIVNCNLLPQDIAATEKKIKDIQEALYEIARKNGIPPGKARLR